MSPDEKDCNEEEQEGEELSPQETLVGIFIDALASGYDVLDEEGNEFYR